MLKTEDRYINCIAHKSSEGNLLIGSEHTALFDCGMMFCSVQTIQNVKQALKGRPLDFIFMTHTHYDHIGALPFFKNEWNDARVVTCAAGAEVLLKSTPRRVIRELSITAAKANNVEFNAQYSDDLFKADITVKDNDVISLGDIKVQTIETPGHTRDSLSFFIPELELLILNETPGVLLPDGNMYPCYLTSYNDTINSIKKCTQLNYKHLSIPHHGVAGKETDGIFEKALKTNTACRDFIISMKEKNLSDNEMLDMFFNRYASETLLGYQPKEAFFANAGATISCTLKECSGPSGT